MQQLMLAEPAVRILSQFCLLSRSIPTLTETDLLSTPGGKRKKIKIAASKISCKKDATQQYTEEKFENEKCQVCDFNFLSYIKLSV